MAREITELRLPVQERSGVTGRNAVRITLWVIVGCMVVGLAEATQVWLGFNSAGMRMSFVRAMKVTVPSWFVLAALAPAVFWMTDRFPLLEDRRPRNWLIHLAAGVAFSALSLILASWISDYLLGGIPDAPPFLANLRRLATSYGVLGLFMYAALVGGWHAWRFNRRLRERERHAADLAVRASRLETSLTNAKLEALRMQLNPHFLFNTLNTVSVLAMKGERSGVTRIVARLSDLLRLSLDHSRQLVPLSEELEFLDGYIEIEEVRFGDRLTVTRQVEPGALEAEVPSLILQPLVENAIRHGIGRTAGRGEIRISAMIRADRLELEVRDTGPGFAASAGRASRGSGIGLKNTQARLEELYGTEQSLEFGDAPSGGAVVRLTLPYRRTARTREAEPTRRGA